MSYSAPQSGIGVAFESTYGTFTSASAFLPAVNASISTNTTKKVEEIKRVGLLERDSFSMPIIYDGSGDISGFFSNIRLLRSLYNTTSSGTSAPFTHNFNSLRNVPLSFSLFSHLGRFAGCVLTNFSYTVRQSELVSARFGFRTGHQPASGTVITTPVPDSNVDTTFAHYHVTVSSGGYDVGEIRELTYSLDVEGDILRIVGTVNPFQPVNLLVKHRVEITELFDDANKLNNFLNDVQSGMTITITQGTGSSQREIRTNLSGGKIISYNYNVAPNSLIEASLTIEFTTGTFTAINASSTP